MSQLYVVFEHASGYGLFKISEFEEVGAFLPQVEEAVADPAKFHSIVKLIGFKPFTSAASALENINAISEGLLTSELSAFLETNLPNIGSKKAKIQLGVGEMKLAAALNEKYGVSVTHVGVVPEIMRGIRQHLTYYVKGLTPASMKQTELGLGHSYSRGKVKFNVNRADNMIIQSISILDQLDKDINTFAMRMKEWYSYHFPELAKVVTDNYQYSLCADAIRDRLTLDESKLDRLEEILMDRSKAEAVLSAAKMSMGMDISPIDLMNIERFARRVISLSEYRMQLANYLKNKMSLIAPNLAVLIGEVVGARLISHSGSLTNLAKCPASTVQILGAEKALFRAIKTKSNTPKYGLIYHSSYISRASSSNKGRISRYLANKTAIASRIDCFSENLTTVFGEKLKGQVEDRLKFYESGDVPRKNLEVMEEASADHKMRVLSDMKKRKHEQTNGDSVEANSEESPKKKSKKKKKKHLEEEQVPAEDSVEAEEESSTSPKKKKKKKKSIAPTEELMEDQPAAEEVPQVNGTPKKKKKKKSLVPTEELMEDQPAAEEVPQVNGTPKKKKKKSISPEEMEVDVNANAAIEEGSSKKKKKKKNKESLEGDQIFLDLNGTLDSTQGEEEPTKKKKKKKKDRQSLEAAE